MTGSADIDRTEPATAEALMRSRFEAFRRSDAAWLLRTWHPSTRPADLDLSDNPRWRGLQIIDTVAGGQADDTGVVEFRATYLENTGGVGVLHERSTFLKQDGRWFYLDGDVD
ncbi:YchJ family metal-binding protein [Corynebacterium sp. USCH3]|uniref:YchJ family protein n=1 Tax=Corynebacterium sp. USCH3 TaxID=3024840 RepID=UPI0030B6B57F